MSASAPGESSASQLSLTLRLSSHPKLVGPSDYPVQLDQAANIEQLKHHIASWDGQPQREGIIIVLGGRICQDHEKVKELFDGEQSGVLHVTIKPSAWTMPFAQELQPVERTGEGSSDEAVGASGSTVPDEMRSVNRPPPRRSSMKQPVITTSAPTPPIIDPDLVPVLPSSPELSRSPPSPIAAFSTPAASASTTAAGTRPQLEGFGYGPYLGLMSQLIPLQRALLLLNLQKAHLYYARETKKRMAKLGWAAEDAEEGDAKAEDEEINLALQTDDDGELREVRQLLSSCELWSVVEESEREAEDEVREWDKQTVHPEDEFQVVNLGGLPYMLHLPSAAAGPQPAPDVDDLRALKRALAIKQVLTTMLQLVMTYQPSSGAIAYGRASLRSPPAPAHGLLAPPPAHVHGHPHLPHLGAGPAAAAALAAAERRPRAVLTMVINLEVVLSILVPLVLLSLKLGFLLWIFGRNASRKKRMILVSMAALYILWEGYGMLRRRAATLDRDAERQRQDRRRADRRAAARAEGDDRAANEAVNNMDPQRPVEQIREGFRQRNVAGRGREQPQDGVEDGGGAAARRDGTPTPTRRRRAPSSRLTPRYWLNWLAAFGLAAEAREMGLVPRSVAGRPVPIVAPRLAQQGPAHARGRAWRTALTAIVLFFGTLSPEVERKRKRALEKRDRLLAERAVARQRRAEQAAQGHAQQQQQADAEAEAAAGLDSPRSGASTPGIFEAEEAPFPHQLGPPQPPPRARSPLGRTPPARPPPINTPQPGSSTGTGTAHPNGSTSQVPTPTAGSPPVSIPRRPGLDTNATYRPPEASHGSAPTTPRAGRTAISDAELFADGLGEPEQDPFVGGSLTETDDEQAVAEGRIETDDEDERRERRERAGEQQNDEVDQIVALF